MAEKKKLGDILKDAGLIDDFQLQSALSHQRSWGGRLGAILVDMGFVSEEDIARVMAERMHIPYVNLFEPQIPEAIVKLIKPDVAKKYGIMPAKKDAGAVVIAMADPMDIQTLDEVRFITGLTIKPALAMDSEIKDAIRKYYDGEDVVRLHKTAVQFQHSGPSEKMELIRGSDLTSGAGPAQQEASPIIPRDEATRLEQTDTKLRLDALISLLIEKDLITRDDLVKMVYQKKIGL